MIIYHVVIPVARSLLKLVILYGNCSLFEWFTFRWIRLVINAARLKDFSMCARQKRIDSNDSLDCRARRPRSDQALSKKDKEVNPSGRRMTADVGQRGWQSVLWTAPDGQTTSASDVGATLSWNENWD